MNPQNINSEHQFYSQYKMLNTRGTYGHIYFILHRTYKSRIDMYKTSTLNQITI